MNRRVNVGEQAADSKRCGLDGFHLFKAIQIEGAQKETPPGFAIDDALLTRIATTGSVWLCAQLKS
jgi:hypothetical protein